MLALALSLGAVQSGGAAVPSLPAGSLLGVWYADQAVASPRRLIPNAAAATAASPNLLSMPRSYFSNNHYWGTTGLTITDNNATAADGTSEASTLVGTGDCYLYPTTAPVMTAGTYTLAISVKRSGGTDQSFTQEFFSAGLTSPTRTATSAWQRFYFTGTVGAGAQTLFAARSVASGGYNLLVADAALYPGTVTAQEEVIAGHMYLGRNHFEAQPAVSAGELDLTGDGWGSIQFPGTALSTYTIISVARRTRNTSTYNTILSSVTDYSLLSPMYEQSSGLQSYFASGNLTTPSLAGAFKLYNRGWKVHAHRFDGSNESVYVNGCRLVHKSPGASPPKTIRSLLIGAFQDPVAGQFNDYKVHAIALYNRSLSEQEVADATAALTAHAALSSLSLTDTDMYWRAEGDSITADTNAYCRKYGANTTQNLLGSNNAVSGDVIANLAARAAALDLTIPAARGNKRFVLSVLIGANDLTAATTVPTFLADLAAYCDARRAAGWYVVLCTILPNTNVGFNAKRNTANTELRLWTAGGSTVAGVHCDAICDFAANATMGPDAAASNATYYPDGIHPSDAGHVILETVLRPVMNAA